MKLSIVFSLIFSINCAFAAEYRVSEVLGVRSILNQQHTFIGFLHKPAVITLNEDNDQKVLVPLFLYSVQQALSKPGNRKNSILIDVLSDYCLQKDCNSLANKYVKITGTIRKLDNWHSKSYALTDISHIEVIEDDDV